MTVLQPEVSTLVKLGSLLVHYQELCHNGHNFDVSVIDTLEADPEVQQWLSGMNELALLPVKR
jgi:hypothetical protein